MESVHSRKQKAFMLCVIIVPFLATILAMILLWQRYVTWLDVSLLIGMHFVTGFGVTIGYHRLLTHKSFETYPAIRALFLALGSMAVEGPAATWASTHLKHHAHSDKEGDPHSPVDGFWHAHFGWIINGWEIDFEKHGPWLKKDRVVMFFERSFLGWAALSLIIPTLIGGFFGGSHGALTGFLWGGLVRIFLTHHATWSVNSICHTFGYRPWKTKDQSKNNWFVGVLALGEGWHNGHHAFPKSATHGLKWWEIDLSAIIIWVMEILGLAWNVNRPSPKDLARKAV